MSWTPLPIGVENFEELRNKGYYYVDKTLFIKEISGAYGKISGDQCFAEVHEAVLL